MSIQDLRDKRASIWDKMKEVMDVAQREGRDLTAEERSTYDKAEKDIEEVEGQIERQERHDARSTQIATVDRSELAPVDTVAARAQSNERYARAFDGYMRGVNLAEMSPDDAKALRSGWQQDTEGRALAVGTQSAGGYLAPAQFDTNLRESILTYSNLMTEVQVINTDTGVAFSWPTVNDTANLGAILAENTQVTEQDVAFGTAQIGAYKYTSKMVRVSMELLQDAAFDVAGYLNRALAERIGRIWNQHFTTGTGSGQPQGIVTGSVVGKTGATGQTTTVTYDDLIDLIDSIDPAYQGNAQFMLNAATRKSVRKLKDTTGQPLWQPSIQAGVPDQLLGYGYVINTDMPVPAANAKSILFGDFRAGYLVRQVLGVQVLRLNELFANYGQSAFLGFARADAVVQNSGAYRAYQNSAT